MTSVRLALSVCVLLALVPSGAAAMELTLYNVITESGRFEFDRGDEEVLTDPPTGSGETRVASAGPFRVWIYLDEIKQARFGYFKYQLYVRDTAAGPSGPITLFTFQGTPVGTFDDQISLVEFDITADGVKVPGKIRLPIFGSIASDALSSKTYTDPLSVFLATEKVIPVPFRNESKGMPVEVRNVRISPGDPSLWKPNAATAFTPFTLDPGATANENVQIRLVPRTASALASAMVPGGSERTDDTIKVNVEYATKGRSARELAITVPVRFVPWPPFLFLVAIAGAFFGTLVPPAAKRRKWQDFWRALGTAAIVTVIIEAFAMLLVANNSKFRLLGFDLDPFQMLPAALLGVLVGLGGFKSLEALRKMPVFDFWKKGKEGAAGE
jgi:hypothetical protein